MTPTKQDDALAALSTIIDTLEAIIIDIRPGVLASGPVKEILKTTVIRIDSVRCKLGKAAEVDPAAPTQIDAGELELALSSLDPDDVDKAVIYKAARAHLSKLSGGE